MRREGRLLFETSESLQTFKVKKIEGKGAKPPEARPLKVLAILADPRSGANIVVREWESEPEPQTQ